MAIDTVVLDIEGTVCPITFVKEKLFPYFLEKLPLFLLEISNFTLLQADDKDPIKAILSQLPEQIRTSKDSVLEYFNDLVRRDIKDPILKQLQGFIWKLGYENGDLKAPVYEDSIEFIKTFPSKTENKRIYIYSSGSIKAQILLFGYVDENGKSVDLNEYLSGYFDITTAGFKTQSSSYTKILEDIGKEHGGSVLFLSDNVLEVEAALEAGMESYVVVRPGNAPLTEDDKTKYKIITSLEQL